VPRCGAPFKAFPGDATCPACGFDLRYVSGGRTSAWLHLIGLILLILGSVGFFWLLLR